MALPNSLAASLVHQLGRQQFLLHLTVVSLMLVVLAPALPFISCFTAVVCSGLFAEECLGPCLFEQYTSSLPHL